MIEEASECLLHCAFFNQLRSKLVVACEKAVVQLHPKLSNKALGRFLHCLALAGKPVKAFEECYPEVFERLEGEQLHSFLFYLTIC